MKHGMWNVLIERERSADAFGIFALKCAFGAEKSQKVTWIGRGFQLLPPRQDYHFPLLSMQSTTAVLHLY
jgi:hypothetical protein